MDGDHGLNNLRFTGYSNEELAAQVEGLRDGAGPETLHNAVSALVSLAEGLAETDKTLRDQLKEIGVTWQGQAAEGGTDATESASIYAGDATSPVQDSAKGVDSQGASFSTTRNGAPEAGTLRGPTEENLGDKVSGFFGHTTDHAKDVRATNQAREQAVDGMNGYQQSSSSALQNSQALPVPPGMSLIAQPVEQQIGTTHVQGFAPGGGLSPAGGGPGGGPAGAAPLPTGGGVSATPGGPTNVGLPGSTTGIGPTGTPGQLPTIPGAGPGGLRTPLSPLAMAETAAVMGAGGAGGAGAAAQGERTIRGGGGGAGAAGAKTPGKSATPLGAAPEEEARAARNAERFGARTGRPGSSIMQPAAAGRRGEGEDDSEHVRRYGIDSGDVFEDDRVVAPESIGDEDDRP
jgi:hypothetical protein